VTMNAMRIERLKTDAPREQLREQQMARAI
jgi:hypothetical protein